MNIVKRHEVITTADGSRTLYLVDLDEQYHSVNGAITESKHVFLKNGLEFLSSKSRIRILEIGFGTGLNALLTAQFAIERNIDISYYAIEKYPLDSETLAQLNYDKLIGKDVEVLFHAIHTIKWEKMVEISPLFRLLKFEADFLSFIFSCNSKVDLIYFDAFGPDKQPEMWSQSVFSRLYELLAPGGAIVTYSAKGEVRRRMAIAGFTVERLPGPPGKREMLRGIKK